MFEDLISDLQLPEYIHVLLNPIPMYGVALGLVALIVGFTTRNRTARIPGLVILTLSGVMAWPVFEYGELAHDRVMTMVNKDGLSWLKEHEERAEKVIAIFYVLAALAATSLVLSWFTSKTATIMSLVTICCACITLGAGVWIGYAGGKIRHSEFRTGPPPPPRSHEHDAEREHH